MACEFHVSGSESSCSLRLDLEPRPTNNRTSQLLALLRDLVLKRWEVLYAWQIYQEQQLQAYVAWVNSQLKKRAGCRMVEDLRRDMQDGVALVHLVEIVSGEALSRVDYDATSATVMRENVERVLQFMASKRIRMHHTSAKDIVDGNLKSIMRLILALAAHYKPSSVKQASQASPMGASPSTPGTPNSTPQRKSQRQPSFTAMAANAAAAIHDARKEAAGAGSGSLRRYKDMTPTHKQGSTNHHTMSPSPVHGNSHIGAHHTGMGSLYPTSTHQSYHHHHYPPTTTPTHDYQHRVLPRGESNDVPDGPLATGASSPLHPSAMVASPNTTSASASPMVNRMGSDRRRAMSPRQQMSLTHMSDSDQGSAGEDGGPHSLPSSRRSSIPLSEALIEEQALMGDSIEDTKKLLQSLQELLLHGKIAEEDGSSEAEEDQIEFEGTTAKEQVVVLQARLNQQQYECNQLRNELSKVKQDCRNLQGTKAGLQSRLTEQDNAILQMKADSLKMGFTQQNLEAENSELKRNFEEKDRQASDISRQLGQKDKLLGQQQEQIESLTHQMLQLNSFKTQLQNRLEESGGSNMELESQIQELSHRLSTVGIAEANLAAHISAHDRKLGKLEGHLHNPDRPSSLGEVTIIISSYSNFLLPLSISLHSSSLLNQQQYECNQLRNELSKVKQDCRNLQGTKAGLQSRLTEQDNAILQMKADSLKMGFTQQNLEAENSELKRNFEEKDRQASDISRQLGQKDKLLGQQQEQIESLTHQMLQLNSFKTQLQNRLEESGGSNMELESQIQELSHRLSTVGIAEGIVSIMDQLQDSHCHNSRPISESSSTESAIMRYNQTRSSPSDDTLGDHKESLSSLDRLSPANNNLSQPCTKGIVSIMDQLQDSHYHNSRPISESSSTESAIRRYNQTRSSPSDDTLGDHKESLTNRLSPANNNLSQPCTKVLYFTERTVTPFMSSIPKRLGEVTLADFKQIFDREGAYRFHFKALDPEFGTVKEEVINDDDILPGWEGKIPCTKVLYFTERTVTPFMSSIPKRLGEVTLADFKQIFDREGAYRFHFKALDPEFGTVKEEVINDDDILPGWEGKIVGWVDEDTG
eukprot:XP_003729987.2 PREDICTED: dixin [Strongylocentrotus purpuratus]